MRTDELTLPGFRHDTFSAVHPSGAASPVFARMPLERHGLRWTHPGACAAHPLDGGRAIALYRDVDATAASLDRIRAGDGDAWRAFVAPLLGSFDAIRATALGGFPPIAGPLRMLRDAGPGGLARLVRLLPGVRARPRPPAVRGRRRARVALRRGRARRRAAGRTRERNAGRPAPPAGARGRLAQSRRRGRAAHRGARWPPAGAGRIDPDRRDRATGARGRRSGDRGRARRRRAARRRAAGDRRRHAPLPRRARRRRARRHVPVDAAPLPLRAGDAQGRLGARRADPVGGAGAARGGHRPRGRRRGRAAGHAGRNLHGTAGGARSCCWDSSRSPIPPARPPGSTRCGPTPAAPAAASTGRRSRTATSSAWRRRSSATPRASATGSSPGTCSARRPAGARPQPRLRRRRGGSYRLRQLVFRPVPSLSPYRTPLAGLYLGSAAAYPGGGVHGVAGDAAARAALADRGRARRRLRI